MNADFKNNGYKVVRNVIPWSICEFVSQYALIDELQKNSKPDHQVKNSYAKYADPAMETVLIDLLSVMEKETELTLYPTYSYYRIYRNDSELLPHTDRESCEISCTVSFNFSYQESDYRWPIYMGKTSVELNPGDLVIYKGIELEHSRKKIEYSEPLWHVQGFFHYVDANGPYSEWKYDKREGIGFLKTVNSSNKSYVTYL